MPTKPFAESCEQNKHVILDVLQQEFTNARQVLEIGSGTGQHAVYFARHLPHLSWQCTDIADNLPGISTWLNEAGLDNTAPPLALDVRENDWPMQKYDAVFSANAVHIMSWQAVESMFTGIGRVLNAGGTVCLYGPFNYGGAFTSDSNARFDAWLKDRDPLSGIRHFEDLNALARQAAMTLVNDYAMPANNRILVWRKH
jgi:cyclopropane fatty-acyl-phospholipid synthase-like methyltransferase